MSSDTLSLRLETLATRRFGCDHCGKRFPGHGFCPDCPEEPLLDLADPYVRELVGQEPSEGMLVSAPGVRWKFSNPFRFAIIAATIGGCYYVVMHPDDIAYLLTETEAGLVLWVGLIVAVTIYRIYEINTRVFKPRIASKLAEISEEEWRLLALLNENKG